MEGINDKYKPARLCRLETFVGARDLTLFCFLTGCIEASVFSCDRSHSQFLKKQLAGKILI